MKLKVILLKGEAMHNLLLQLPELINLVFNALDLLVVRSALLILSVVGAVSLLRGNRNRQRA